jgi:hypothetical protein
MNAPGGSRQERQSEESANSERKARDARLVEALQKALDATQDVTRLRGISATNSNGGERLDETSLPPNIAPSVVPGPDPELSQARAALEADPDHPAVPFAPGWRREPLRSPPLRSVTARAGTEQAFGDNTGQERTVPEFMRLVRSRPSMIVPTEPSSAKLVAAESEDVRGKLEEDPGQRWMHEKASQQFRGDLIEDYGDRRNRLAGEDTTRAPRLRRSWLKRTISLMLASAGVVAFGFFAYRLVDVRVANPDVAPNKPGFVNLMSSKMAGETVKEPRLVLSEMSGASNRPMALGVSVDPVVAGTAVVVRGLQTGSRLTVGTPENDGAWRVSIRDLPHAMVIPPLGFAGTMNASVDLRRSDDSIIDSDILRLNWTDQNPDPMLAKPVTTTVVRSPPNTASPFPPPSSSRTAPVVAPVAAPAAPVLSAAEPRVDAPQAATTAMLPPAATPPVSATGPQQGSIRQLDRAELRYLLERGEAALQTGDLAAARLLLGRAAEAGDINAALAIGATYDPRILAQRRIIGANPDPAKARSWYQRAADAGSPEARRRLQDLPQ